MIIMDSEKKICPIVNVDGLIAGGKQYDIDITLPEDNRSVIYGIIKDAYDEPVRDSDLVLVLKNLLVLFSKVSNEEYDDKYQYSEEYGYEEKHGGDKGVCIGIIHSRRKCILHAKRKIISADTSSEDDE